MGFKSLPEIVNDWKTRCFAVKELKGVVFVLPWDYSGRAKMMVYVEQLGGRQDMVEHFASIQARYRRFSMWWAELLQCLPLIIAESFCLLARQLTGHAKKTPRIAVLLNVAS